MRNVGNWGFWGFPHVVYSPWWNKCCSKATSKQKRTCGYLDDSCRSQHVVRHDKEFCQSQKLGIDTVKATKWLARTPYAVWWQVQTHFWCLMGTVIPQHKNDDQVSSCQWRTVLEQLQRVRPSHAQEQSSAQDMTTQTCWECDEKTLALHHWN